MRSFDADERLVLEVPYANLAVMVSLFLTRQSCRIREPHTMIANAWWPSS